MKSILVVDDDEVVLESICAQLSLYKTYAAPSGKWALEMARVLRPNLILLDVNMPGMDGFDVLIQLQRQGLRDIPVIFLTASEDPLIQIRGLKSGAADFIHKPVNGDILYHRIKLHLQFAAYTRSLERSIEEMEDHIGYAFADLIECKDYNFSGHVLRTAKYAELLGLCLYDKGFFSPELTLGFIDTMTRSTPFHDIGKIGISEEILRKKGPLSEDEFKTVRGHTLIGAGILKDIHEQLPGRDYFKTAELIARFHHERYDGTGYPFGFSGDRIPLCCRIVAVANVYDACVSDRVYHPAMEHSAACEEIRRGSGSEFDPRIVDVFLENSGRFDRLKNELQQTASILERSPSGEAYFDC
ncbi:MAG: response regulator [Spirochaetaceae bacterium]|jgi:putative two-component system response regulator|nr:response regulator [Spirochaetaceae bacterium]